MMMDKAFKMFASRYFPHFLQYETGNRCNTNCLMCPHDIMTRKRGTMSWALMGKIVRELVPMVNAVCPFLMQEPTLEVRLLSILRFIKETNPQCLTIVYSNMADWDKDLSRQIIASELLDELHISFYGPTEEMYKKWQPGLNWVQTVDNIRYVHEYRALMRRKKPKIDLHYLAIPELMNLLPQMNELFNGYADSIGIVHYDTFHGDVEDYGDEEFYFGPAVEERTPCPRLWSGFNILWNGDVVPCCIDYNAEMVMGNILRDSGPDIWRGFAFDGLRKLHIDGAQDSIPLCKDCTLWKRQHGDQWNDLWLPK